MTQKASSDLVRNLNSARDIVSQFAVIEKTLRTASSGRNYLDLTLTDKSGEIKGRMFPENNAEKLFNSINTGCICKIEGRVNEFPPGSSKYNIIIDSLTELGEENYILDDFVRTSDENKDDLISEIITTIRGIGNPHLKNLLKSFFCDKEFADEFYISPAAMMHHHNYQGGLLDHTVEVLKISKTLCEIFPELDRDLLYTGVLLHDVGKIKSYDYDSVKIQMTKESILLDHLYLSAEMVKEKMDNFPDDLSHKVLHLILSHHGDVKLGWGSTVNPKLPEAVALHHADHLDAKVKKMFQ